MTVRAGREFLAIPGPTTMPDEVLQAMHRPALDIYSREMVDLSDGRVRRIVRKRIDDDDRLGRQRGFLLGDPDAFTFAGRTDPSDNEPFAFIHRSGQ